MTRRKQKSRRARVRRNPSDLAERLLEEQAKQARKEGVEDSPNLFTLDEIEAFLDYCMEAERSVEACLAGVDLFDVNGSNASVEAVWDKVVGTRTLWQATISDDSGFMEVSGLHLTEAAAIEEVLRQTEDAFENIAGARQGVARRLLQAEVRGLLEQEDLDLVVEEVLGRTVARLRYAEGTARVGVLRDYAEDESVNEDDLSEPAQVLLFSQEEMEEFPELAQVHDELVGAGWDVAPSGGLLRATYTRRPPPWEA